MSKIDFGEHGGGLRHFDVVEEALDYISQRIVEFRPDDTFAESETWRKPIVHRWLEIQEEIIRRRDADLMAEREPDFELNGFLALKAAIRRDSKAGEALFAINAEFGSSAARSAAWFATRLPDEQISMPNTRDGIIGVVAFSEAMVGSGDAAHRASQIAYKNLVKSIQNDVEEHRRQLLDYCENHEAKVGDLNIRLEQEMRQWNEWRTVTGGEVQADRQQWSEDWNSAYNAFTEQLSIEAPVALWNLRALEHTRNARRLRLSIASFCIIGAFLLIGLIPISLKSVHHLMGDPNASAGQFSPHELIFSASLLLFYLTMFFWLMRIVVRMYMTEHHLGIDAKSRAAMAETYLSLTKQRVATDQDRAIVLATLFRPVVDGIVKDDGLPAITPAAILSGLAGGKAHAGN